MANQIELSANKSNINTIAMQKSISDAFDIFDHESNKTVDMRYFQFAVLYVVSLKPLFFQNREIGTIVRSLKCCPTEGELHDILADVSF